MLQDRWLLTADARTVGWRFDEFGQSEIEHLCVPVRRDHDVVGLEIAMNDSRAVSFCESFGDVLQRTQQFWKLFVFGVNLRAERRAFDVLHRDEVEAGRF